MLSALYLLLFNLWTLIFNSRSNFWIRWLHADPSCVVSARSSGNRAKYPGQIKWTSTWQRGADCSNETSIFKKHFPLLNTERKAIRQRVRKTSLRVVVLWHKTNLLTYIKLANLSKVIGQRVKNKFWYVRFVPFDQILWLLKRASLSLNYSAAGKEHVQV